MATKVVKKSKTMTKRDRSKVRGTASRRKTTIRNKGGNVNVAMVGKTKRK